MTTTRIGLVAAIGEQLVTIDDELKLNMLGGREYEYPTEKEIQAALPTMPGSWGVIFPKGVNCILGIDPETRMAGVRTLICKEGKWQFESETESGLPLSRVGPCLAKFQEIEG